MNQYLIETNVTDILEMLSVFEIFVFIQVKKSYFIWKQYLSEYLGIIWSSLSKMQCSNQVHYGIGNG